MDNLKPPGNLLLEGNIAENYKKWVQKLEFYMVASGKSEKEGNIKCATFFNIAGDEAIEVYNAFTYGTKADGTAEEKDDYELLKKKFSDHCEPRKNLSYLSHLFFKRCQGQNETIDQYVTDLKNKAKQCEFGVLQNRLIMHILVCGIRDLHLQGRLLRDADLTLDKAVVMCRASETTSQQIKALHTDSAEQQILQLNRQSQKKSFKHDGQRENYSSTKFKCGKCGYEHEKLKCPAYGKHCNNCNNLHHFGRMCKSKQKKRQDVHVIEQNDDSDYSDDLFVGMVNTENNNDQNDKWSCTLTLNEQPVVFKIDTGAQCSVMPTKLYTKLFPDTQLQKSRVRLLSYSGHKIVPDGQAQVLCEHKGKFYTITIQVIPSDSPPILGRNESGQIGVVKRIFSVATGKLTSENVFEEYSDVFKGIGDIPGEYHIKVDPNIKPVQHPPRKVPVALRAKVKAELQRMEDLGVIKKVTEPTDWVNSMVTVVKGDKVRICLDPKHLNCAIKREHYPMNTIEEISARLGAENARYYSVLDCSSSFWMVKLDSESQKLCTFNTPLGRRSFVKMPFGINSASEVFQRKMSEIFVEQMEGVECIVDDLIVFSSTKEEHDERLLKVLQKVREYNIKLNKSKCKIGVTELKYCGHIISETGL